MTDKAASVLPSSSRDPVDRINDDMLLRPLRTLTPPERAMIRRAINGARSDEFAERVVATPAIARSELDVSAIPTALATRTERDIATSTIVALLEAGVLPRDPNVIARAARVINVPVQDIIHAWTARMTGIERPPNRGKTTNHPRWRAKNPEPDKRVCSRCGLIKSQDDFDMKDKSRG